MFQRQQFHVKLSFPFVAAQMDVRTVHLFCPLNTDLPPTPQRSVFC